VTLAQDLAALRPALVPLITEDDRFLTLEWYGGGLSHPMLSGTDFWSISTGNVETEVEPYVAAFPAPAEIGGSGAGRLRCDRNPHALALCRRCP